LPVEPFTGGRVQAGCGVGGVKDDVDVEQDHLKPSPSA
jgi:hypothetical protein